MLICPRCQSEYRDGFVHCNSCDVALVTPEAFQSDDAGLTGLPQDALKDVETGIIPQPHLPAARELEAMILDAEIPCYVVAQEADQDVALGSSSALMYGVVVAKDDIERVRELFQEHFAASLEREGVGGGLQTEAVDLNADEVQCPACTHVGPLEDGECADCGLFLGIPN